jgi:intracellular septation protein A
MIEAIEFILKNFATPIAFFWMFHVHGAKPAIALAIGVTGLQLLAHWRLKLKISPFFIVASGFTVLFGVIDLFLATPRFFRLEPFAQNMIMGLVFLTTVILKKPIAVWFANALPERVRPDLTQGSQQYLRNVTLVWGFYFILKAFLFLYIALKVDLGRLVILRTVIGGGSLLIIFGGEIFYRKYLRRAL